MRTFTFPDTSCQVRIRVFIKPQTVQLKRHQIGVFFSLFFCCLDSLKCTLESLSVCDDRKSLSVSLRPSSCHTGDISSQTHTHGSQPRLRCGHSLIPPSTPPPPPASQPPSVARCGRLRSDMPTFSASLFWPAVCKDYPAPRVSLHRGRFQ